MRDRVYVKSRPQGAPAVGNKLDPHSPSLHLHLSGHCILSVQRQWELLPLWHSPPLPHSQRDLVSCILVSVNIIPVYTPYRVRWGVQFQALTLQLTPPQTQTIQPVFGITLSGPNHCPLTLPPILLLYIHFLLA